MTNCPFEAVKQIPILDVLDSLNVWYAKKWVNYFLKRDNWEVDESFVVYPDTNSVHDNGKTWISGSIIDFVGQSFLWLSSSDMKNATWRANALKYLISKWIITPPSNTVKFEKGYSKEELLENFEELTIWGYSQHIASFLKTRGFEHDWIIKHQLRVWEIFANIGFYENFFCSEWWDSKPKQTPVFMFPCYDEQWTLIWIKLRRKDGKLIWGKKSFAVGKTGLIYDQVDIGKMIITEGEMDYIVLKLLWYDNVVWNLCWVMSWRTKLKSLLSETANIICLYDSDDPWIKWKLALQDTFKRQIKEIEYPIRKDNSGVDLKDVNDYFEVWFDTKIKWDKILSTAKLISLDKVDEYPYEFVFLRSTLEYYDIEHKKIQQTWPTAAYMGITPKELATMVKGWQIKTYTDLCYREGWKQWHYNTLDETTIMKHGWDAESKLHPHIKYLIENICNEKECNIEWLHKSILYKLTHLNDSFVPALILYGFGWSGKWTLLTLLWKIFWKVNMQTWLGQKDLEWSFDSYQWEKLIVEYKEVSSWNRHQDKKVLDKIKSIISEKIISVRALYQNARQVESIARFHFSSNHALPLQLDSKHSGNRRFTVIKTWWALDTEIAREMNEVTFENEQVIREYVAWLYETYPEIPKMTTFKALDNKEKRELENNCEEVGNIFFEWFETNYPNIIKISNPEKNKLLRMYCQEMWEDHDDKKFNQSNFDLWLSHKYEKKVIKLRWKSPRWYFINKNKFELEKIEWERSEFREWEVNGFII